MRRREGADRTLPHRFLERAARRGNIPIIVEPARKFIVYRLAHPVLRLLSTMAHEVSIALNLLEKLLDRIP